VFRSAPYTKLAKVGKYEVLCQARDNPKNDSAFDNYRLWSGDNSTCVLYVHRRPIAQFGVKAVYNSSTGQYNITVNESSYDLDHTSRADKGIVERKWRYKEASAAAWTNGPLPSSLPSNKTYIASLEVRDMEFEWSEPCVVTFSTTSGNLPPVAMFTITPNPLPIYMNATITDTSYDPNNDAITARTWTLFKGASQVYTGSTAPTNYNPYGTGSYTLKLKVRDSNGAWSDEYAQDFEVIADILPPNLTITPMSRDWANTNVSVTITASDSGSGFKRVDYRWTNSIAKPTSGWTSSTSSNFATTQSGEGVWYLHAIAYDNSDNQMYKMGGPYKIDKTAPTITLDPETVTDTTENITVRVTASDALSGIDHVNYAWTKSTSKPTSGWETSTQAEFNTTLSSKGETWYLHVEAFDKAGNSYYKRSGEYKITEIEAYGLTVNWISDINWIEYFFTDTTEGSPRRPESQTDIKVDKFPINYWQYIMKTGLERYPAKGVKAGIYNTGYIHVKGNPDSVRLKVKWYWFWDSYLNRKEKEKGWQYSYIDFTKAKPNDPNDTKWKYEWNIPLYAKCTLPSDSEDLKKNMIQIVQIEIRKNGKTYGNEVWNEPWRIDAFNNNRDNKYMFYVRRNTLDELQFNRIQ
jgi:hypothetical protein